MKTFITKKKAKKKIKRKVKSEFGKWKKYRRGELPELAARNSAAKPEPKP